MAKSAVRFSSSSGGLRRMEASGLGVWGVVLALAICAFRASPIPRPDPSATTMVWCGWLFSTSRPGSVDTSAANRGTARVAIQNPLFRTRCRYSRFRMTKTFSSRIAHRLHEDLFELRLLGAELADFEESDHLPQRLGAVGVRPEHQLCRPVPDGG